MAALAWMTVPVHSQEGERGGNQTAKPPATFERLADGQPIVQARHRHHERQGSASYLHGRFLQCNAQIVERLTFVDRDNMIYEATIEDPTVFTRPWTLRVAERRRADEEMWESACYEGAVNPDEFLIKKRSGTEVSIRPC
jgi:hypothetical protein